MPGKLLKPGRTIGRAFVPKPMGGGCGMNGVETEIKLLASPAILEALRQHRQLAGEEHSCELVTTYFDTPDGRLRRAGASLRLRSGDGEPEQTFKRSDRDASDKRNGGPTRREEWNVPATGARPDPQGFPGAAATALARIVDGQETAPFAVVKVQRRTRQIRHGGSLIKVAFDSGQIEAAGGVEAICELELELVEGKLADALALALALPLGPELRWSVAAKGNRAFALAHGEAARAVRAGNVVLTPAMRITDAFRTICWNCLDHLLANYGLIVAGANNEALHQCRVAIRRLRAALALFSGSVDRAAATHFRDAFRNAAAAMGEARELHVLLEALAKSGQVPTDDDSGLISELTARRDAALAPAAAQLGSEAFQRLLFEFASWIETADSASADPAAAPEALPQFAARVLNRHRKRVKRAGRHLHAMTDQELHQLRIKVKKLRYAVEFFACLAEQGDVKPADKFENVLGKLQDRLGALHDLSERSAHGPLFADYDPARAARWQDELERRLGPADRARDDLVDGSARALAKLLALPRWWQADIMETEMTKEQEKHSGKDGHSGHDGQLKALQIRLTALQRQIIADGRKLLIIFEGRDAAGKDGTIKRIVEHMSPRDTRIVAMGIPTVHDLRAWYFQRWCAELPVAGEIVLFNRSWYNRAGVEHVMGFCTDAEYEEFMENVPLFEQLLAHSGFTVIKYYLDISKDEQKRRLRDRERDPLKHWKNSPVDGQATRNWKKYSEARNAMLARTHSAFAPWVVVKADDKRTAHLALIRDLLARCGAADPEVEGLPDPATAFLYDAHALENGWLAK
jgi:polyphosphate kinase 2